MPVERDVEGRDEEFGEEVKSAPPPEKKKKKSKLRSILLSAFLLVGVVTGLHISGVIDARPFIWSTVPKLPFVGDYLKKYLDIPEAYSLTTEERRRIELEQWQARLDAREREATQKLSEAQAISNDLAAKLKQVQKQEEEQRAVPDKKAAGAASDEEKALMNELMKTYQEISPRRAALIVARLKNELAVELLRKLPQDARASILSKLDPRKAATITELLATPEN